jgi:hypothetical protein
MGALIQPIETVTITEFREEQIFRLPEETLTEVSNIDIKMPDSRIKGDFSVR